MTDWYDNKALYEMMVDLSKGLEQTNAELAKTQTMIKDYNGLREKIIAIVNHITAGLMPGTLSWMRNPAAKASAHYLVTRDGRIYRMVNDNDTAWHAGFVNRPSWRLYDGSNPNAYTIGIEHENMGGGQLTDAQYQAALWLHRYLIKKHNLPISRDSIIGHCEIDAINRPNDPGKNFPWDILMADLKEGEEVIYKNFNDLPTWAKPTIKKMVDRKSIQGNEKGDINLSEDMVRTFVILDREKVLK